ncbi:MAG TPA: ABC transporter permease [bacterium]|nr:ABC transporter permease [bacterium]
MSVLRAAGGRGRTGSAAADVSRRAATAGARLRAYAARVVPPVVLLAIILAGWEAAVRVFGIPFYILPAPSRIAGVLADDHALLLGEAAVTLGEVLLGFAIAFVVGVVLALAIFSSRTVERAVYPLVIASQTVPVFAIAPLLVVWFGYGTPSKIVMAALIVFFPIVVNTVDGLRAADPDMVNLLVILGAGPAEIVRRVRVPAALPFVFSGTRIAIATSVIGAVIGEWVGSTRGLGYLMIHANAQLHVDLVFAVIVYLSVMATALFWTVSLAEWTALPWRRAEAAAHTEGEV